MTKAELVGKVSEKSGLNKKQTEEAVKAFVETVTESLAKGDSIQLVGFGTFEVRDRAARKGINPRTKEAINIEATKVPAFKAGRALKEAVAAQANAKKKGKKK